MVMCMIFDDTGQEGAVVVESDSISQKPQDQDNDQDEANESITHEPKNRGFRKHLIPSLLLVLIALTIVALWSWLRINELEQLAEEHDMAIVSIDRNINTLDKDIVTLGGQFSSLRSDLNYTTRLARNADNYAHSHNTWSDSRLKTDIQPIQNTLDGLLSLNGVRYNWNEIARVQFGLGSSPQIGLLAEDVEAIFPELVTIDYLGYKQVDYERLSAVLVEALKTQQMQLDQLEARIELIENR